jgi:hypothetical protein
MICFGFLSMGLSRSYNLVHVFNELTRVEWGHFIVSYFVIEFFFLISSFNNKSNYVFIDHHGSFLTHQVNHVNLRTI